MVALPSSSTVLAQDTQGLYAPAPPPDSAFVRVINTSTTPLSANLGNKTAAAPKAGISPYVVIPQGTLAARSNGSSVNLSVVAGKFYSAVWTGKTFKLITDSGADDRAKALLTVYNLSRAASLDLKTADGKLAVVSGVKPGESGSRAVNGITVDLAAFSGSKVVATFKAVALERGNAYAVVITDTGSSLTLSSTTTK
ncbi:alginate O-acetyltransferase AlgF [Deinococcus sp.]|uniref:alginate O-acetyltransferase AlgF n=1 Tax=Deinococcus sp. TaxID=47478 RepID=UPI003C7C5478